MSSQNAITVLHSRCETWLDSAQIEVAGANLRVY